MTETPDSNAAVKPAEKTPAVSGALLQMLQGYRRTQIVHTAAQLGLPDQLAAQPRTSAELAAATGTDEVALVRLLRGLACIGVVSEIEPGRYELTDIGRPLCGDAPNSLRNLVLLFCEEGNWRAWGELTACVQSGEPALPRLYGQRPFEYLAHESDRSETFNRAMGEYTKITIAGIVSMYDFGRFGHLVDVGGNDGTLIAAILAAHPGLAGTLFDTPSGVKEAPDVLAAAGVADRCPVVDGDFFESVPTGGDAYLLKSIVHDWSDDRAVEILRSVRRSVPAGGTLLVVESVLPSQVETASPVLTGTVMMDLHMLVTTGGRERTADDFSALLAAADFRLERITDPVEGNNYRVIEATPV